MLNDMDWVNIEGVPDDRCLHGAKQRKHDSTRSNNPLGSVLTSIAPQGSSVAPHRTRMIILSISLDIPHKTVEDL